MKALLEAHGVRYQRTHNILGICWDASDRLTPNCVSFRLGIPPDIYSAYAGEQEYEEEARAQPLLTNQPDYQTRTVADAQRIIDRAREVRQQRGD